MPLKSKVNHVVRILTDRGIRAQVIHTRSPEDIWGVRIWATPTDREPVTTAWELPTGEWAWGQEREHQLPADTAAVFVANGIMNQLGLAAQVFIDREDN